MLDLTQSQAAAWKNGEVGYCLDLVVFRGDDSVGHDPKTIATYLRLQSSTAFRDREYEISARLAAAANCINEDARNNHEPKWDWACEILLHWEA